MVGRIYGKLVEQGQVTFEGKTYDTAVIVDDHYNKFNITVDNKIVEAISAYKDKPIALTGEFRMSMGKLKFKATILEK